MFFNGKKITQRAPNAKRSFEFTDKFCRNFDAGDEEIKTLSDKLCKNLRMSVSKSGNHSFMYQGMTASKVIGSVYQMTVKEAREIVNNINQNRDEFMREFPNIKLPLVAYFQKYGKFPHKPNGTEVVISNENASLKEKIKDLQAENESLKAEIQTLSEENRKYYSRLITIKKVVGGVYEEDTEVND